MDEGSALLQRPRPRIRPWKAEVLPHAAGETGRRRGCMTTCSRLVLDPEPVGRGRASSGRSRVEQPKMLAVFCRSLDKTLEKIHLPTGNEIFGLSWQKWLFQRSERRRGPGCDRCTRTLPPAAAGLGRAPAQLRRLDEIRGPGGCGLSHPASFPRHRQEVVRPTEPGNREHAAEVRGGEGRCRRAGAEPSKAARGAGPCPARTGPRPGSPP